jgi:hypothetical protein
MKLHHKVIVISTAISTILGQRVSAQTESIFCLTANSSLGTSLRLGDCSQPATLTHWSVN